MKRSILFLTILALAVKAQNFSGIPSEEESAPSDAASATPTAGEGESVDLRHHWKRPYSYGYGANYYGGYAYPSSGYSGYNSNYAYNYNRQPSYSSYQPSYSYGYGQPYYGGGSYNNYYSSFQQYSSGGSYFGLGYREKEKEANKDASVDPAAAVESVPVDSGDSITFN